MVYNYHVGASLLQMIAADLITAKKHKGILSWVICCKKINSYILHMKYKSDSNWKGIHFHPRSLSNEQSSGSLAEGGAPIDALANCPVKTFTTLDLYDIAKSLEKMWSPTVSLVKV